MLCWSYMTTQKFSGIGWDTHHTFYDILPRLSYETIPPAILSSTIHPSTIPTFQHYKKLLVLQEAHFTAYTTFILRPDLFWTTNHIRVLWKQLNIILSLRSESLDTHMFLVNKACTGISKYNSLCFLCGEVFCVEKFSVCPYTWLKILILTSILTQLKNILNVKPLTNKKLIAWHCIDIYRLRNWPLFLVPIGTLWSLELRQ